MSRLSVMLIGIVRRGRLPASAFMVAVALGGCAKASYSADSGTPKVVLKTATTAAERFALQHSTSSGFSRSTSSTATSRLQECAPAHATARQHCSDLGTEGVWINDQHPMRRGPGGRYPVVANGSWIAGCARILQVSYNCDWALIEPVRIRQTGWVPISAIGLIDRRDMGQTQAPSDSQKPPRLDSGP
jgi:hypothetical protein